MELLVSGAAYLNMLGSIKLVFAEKGLLYNRVPLV